MPYRITAKANVYDDLKVIPLPFRDKIQAAIFSLADNPRPVGAIKMTEYKNAYRIRVGNYRIGYQIFDRELVVTVVAASERGKIYQLMKRRLK